MNYEQFICEIVKPLVTQPEAVNVKQTGEKGKTIYLEVGVAPADLGRIIGRRGRIANALRTIVFACCIRHGHKIDLSFVANEA